MKIKIYPLTLLLLFIILGCNKENMPETVINQPKPDEPSEQMESDDCVPILSIDIDTSYLWFGLERRPFKGRQEHGVAEMVEKNSAYFWEGSAEAYRNGNNLRILLETVKSEEIYYSFKDILDFELIVDNSICLDFVDSKEMLQENNAFAKFYHGDGDVIFFDYTVIEYDNSHFEIVELDTVNRRVSANFSLKLLHDRSHPSPFVPDTLHFVNGSFTCEILE